MAMLRRPQLAEKYGLGLSTVSRIVKEMKAAGYTRFWESPRYLFIEEGDFCEYMGQRTRKERTND